jgi:hypothetical protein
MESYHQPLIDLVTFTAEVCAASCNEAVAGNRKESEELLGLAKQARNTAQEIRNSNVSAARCWAYFALGFLRDNSTCIGRRTDLKSLREQGIAVFQRIHELAFDEEIAVRKAAKTEAVVHASL